MPLQHRLKRTPASNKRGRFLLIVSWLLARVLWTVEISRLAILRSRPKMAIHRLALFPLDYPPCQWLLDQDRLFCVGIDEGQARIFIRETPLIDPN